MKLQKLDFLIALYMTCLITSELMGSKTVPLINLFGYQLNAGVALLTLPIIFTINDIIVEVYGKDRARSIVRSGILMIVFLIIFSLIATNLPPSTRFAKYEDAYDYIFNKSIRISIASLIAIISAEFADIFIFTKIRAKFGKSKLWLRNNLSNWSAQLIDTVIFMTLAFYELSLPFDNNLQFLLSIIIPYWLLKCTMSAIETPLVYIGVKWLKKDKIKD